MLQILASPLARAGLLVLGAALAVWAAYSWAYGRGYDACEKDHQAALAESLQRGLEQAQDIARQDAEVSEFYERWRTRKITTVQEVVREITPDCAQCGIGSHALGLLNEARGYESSEAAADPGKPDYTLPTTPHGGDGQITGLGRQFIGHQPGLLRLRHAAQPVGQGSETSRGGT